MYHVHTRVTTRNLPLRSFDARLCVALLVMISTIRALAGTDPFPQPIANPFEGRIQVFASPDARALRFDIGASPVMYARDSTLTIRSDFFTLSRMRSAEAMKFPVETIDYWFGLSAAWASRELPISMRLRLAHVSAHFVDGTRWPFTADSTVPIYSREFAELLIAAKTDPMRFYGGVTFIWSNHNPEFARVIPQIGVEYTHCFTSSMSVVAAYDGKLVGYRGVTLPQHCAQVGFLYRHRTDIEGGLMVYRYSGRSIHGMFAQDRDDYWAVGLRLGMP